MDIPKFHETFTPILKVLSDGNTIHSRELLNQVVSQFYSTLPKELLEKTTKSSDVLIMNRIARGKSYLKKGGFIHFPERGVADAGI